MGSRCVVLCPDCKSQEIGFCSDEYKFDEDFPIHEVEEDDE